MFRAEISLGSNKKCPFFKINEMNVGIITYISVAPATLPNISKISGPVLLSTSIATFFPLPEENKQYIHILVRVKNYTTDPLPPPS